MRRYLVVVCFFSNLYLFAQTSIKGKVIGENAIALEGVSVYYKNTYLGVTTNRNGHFLIHQKSQDTLVFQYLGYKTQELLPSSQDDWTIQLEPEYVSLRQIVIEKKEDPAYAIIREAIAKREANKTKLTSYEADFYSRGMVEAKLDSVFLKRIGENMEEEDLKDTIIPYLSETISRIYVNSPKHFFEEINASKVSGQETLFSYNSAEEAEISFYDSSLEVSRPILSPIANNALQFYNYKFEGDFYQGNQLINKISISPKHNSDRVWTGTIYIVEDTSEFYGIDVSVDAAVLQIPMLKTYRIKQTFVYNDSQNAWVKNLQEISFEGKFLKNFFYARFIAHYQDYKFGVPEHKFTRERMRILPEVIKTDGFWEEKRPIPLTKNEIKDYTKKDSLQDIRKSKIYLDSIDKRFNKLKPLDIATGYSYRNSLGKWILSYGGLANSPGFYNTVQGISLGSYLSFSKQYAEDYTNYLNIRTYIDYGISDERLRVSGQLTRKFNSIHHAKLDVFAGVKTSQFNREESIKPLWNSVYTIFDNRNYMKLYDLGRYGASYSQEITNGIFLSAEAAWERRSPLYNTKTRKKYADRLSSNNPLQPDVEASAPFAVHSLLRTKIGLQFRFAQEYFSHPNQKIINSVKGPIVYLGMIAGAFASDEDMDFLQFQMKIRQNVKLGQIGNTKYLVHAGTFVKNRATSFADFQHFTGNETFIGHAKLESFQMLPYYQHSTDNSYLALHWEHHFKDAILRRIPIIRDLKLQLVGGANLLTVKDQKPYTEWYIGLDKIGLKSWRLLRVDFVKSYNDGANHSGIRLRVGL